MPWRAAISWIGISPPPWWRARSSTARMAYSPFAEIRMRVPMAASSTLAIALEPARDVLGEVRDHDVGAGAPDGRERLHHRALLFEPAELRRGLEHRILPRHRVSGQGHAELLLGARDHIEVRQGRLHHDDVRAFVEIERDLAHGLLGVGRIHLVGAAVTELGRRVRRLTEGTVKG